MRFSEIIEGVDAPDLEVYHWTDAEALRQIMKHNSLLAGASTHDLGGRRLRGVSLARNPFFDLSQTFAIAGRKSWRIGLNYRKLRNDFRVIPIRDQRYRNVHPAKPGKEAVYYGLTRLGFREVSSDETEEFCLASIYPFWHYVSSIAVEERWIDMSLHPSHHEGFRFWDDDDPERPEYDDQVLLFQILQGSILGTKLFHKKFGHRYFDYPPIRIPERVRLLVIDRASMQTHRMSDYAAFLGATDAPQHYKRKVPYGADEDHVSRGDRIKAPNTQPKPIPSSIRRPRNTTN